MNYIFKNQFLFVKINNQYIEPQNREGSSVVVLWLQKFKNSTNFNIRLKTKSTCPFIVRK